MDCELTRIGEVVETVVAEATDGDAAREERILADAALLAAVIKKVKPALRAIGTRPEVEYNVRHHADVNYYGGVTKSERYDHRCVLLSDDAAGPDEDCPRANAGAFEGRQLFLREDGALLLFIYSGDWSRWQGSSWGWEAEVVEFDGEVDAVRHGWGDVGEYVERLSKKLEKAVGQRKSRADADRKRAEKVRALAALL